MTEPVTFQSRRLNFARRSNWRRCLKFFFALHHIIQLTATKFGKEPALETTISPQSKGDFAPTYINFWDPHIRTNSLTSSNQNLHGDQIRWRGSFTWSMAPKGQASGAKYCDPPRTYHLTVWPTPSHDALHSSIRPLGIYSPRQDRRLSWPGFACPIYGRLKLLSPRILTKYLTRP